MSRDIAKSGPDKIRPSGIIRNNRIKTKSVGTETKAQVITNRKGRNRKGRVGTCRGTTKPTIDEENKESIRFSFPIRNRREIRSRRKRITIATSQKVTNIGNKRHQK